MWLRFGEEPGAACHPAISLPPIEILIPVSVYTSNFGDGVQIHVTNPPPLAAGRSLAHTHDWNGRIDISRSAGPVRSSTARSTPTSLIGWRLLYLALSLRLVFMQGAHSILKVSSLLDPHGLFLDPNGLFL